MAAIAALTLGAVSCSSDEPNSGGNTDKPVTEGEKFLAININNVGNSGSRAEGDTYEPGVGNENTLTANDVRFYFFTSKGNPFTLSIPTTNGKVEKTNMVTPTELAPNTTNGNTTGTLKGVLVLGKKDAGITEPHPTYMICVANRSKEGFDAIANNTMAYVYSNMRTTIETGSELPTDKFIMSSSSYVGQDTDGKEVVVYYTVLKDEDFKADVAAAEANPVDIYIERLVCKVRVEGLKLYRAQKDDKTTNTLYPFTSGTGTFGNIPLYIELDGWQMLDTYTKCKIFKNIDKDGDYYPNWNDAPYHRSYWAETPDEEGNLDFRTFDIQNANQFKLKNYSSMKPTENIAYVYPNTAWSFATKYAPTTVGDRRLDARTTAVVVRGTVKYNKKDVKDAPADQAEEYVAIDLVYYAGSYYIESSFKQVVANAYNSLDANDKITGISTVTVDDINFKKTAIVDKSDANHYDVYVKTSAFPNGRFQKIQWWKGGHTSYVVNIRHADTADGKAIYGLVRNHIYNVNVTGVVGLGVPGNDRENPDPEKETFLAARVNVLNWKVVNNNTVLQ